MWIWSWSVVRGLRIGLLLWEHLFIDVNRNQSRYFTARIVVGELVRPYKLLNKL